MTSNLNFLQNLRVKKDDWPSIYTTGLSSDLDTPLLSFYWCYVDLFLIVWWRGGLNCVRCDPWNYKFRLLDPYGSWFAVWKSFYAIMQVFYGLILCQSNWFDEENESDPYFMINHGLSREITAWKTILGSSGFPRDQDIWNFDSHLKLFLSFSFSFSKHNLKSI